MNIIFESLQEFKSNKILNEQIFAIGLGIPAIYSHDIESEFKKKIDSLLDEGSWKNFPEVIKMYKHCKELADMWNNEKTTKERNQLHWLKKDKNGKVLTSNFINPCLIIFVLLKQLVGKQKATSVKLHSIWRTQCFEYSIQWKNHHKNSKIIGGIVINRGNVNHITYENLTVHVFNEKNKKYYDSTFSDSVVNNLIYFSIIRI